MWTGWNLMVTCFLLMLTKSNNAFSKREDFSDASVHLLMTKEERHLVFGNHDQIPQYEMVHPMQIAKRRTRRTVSTSTDENSEDDLVIRVNTSAKPLQLQLTQQRHLTVLPMKLEILGENGTETQYIMDHPECLYHGRVKGLVDSLVALSTCNPGEITGVIHLSDSDHYILVPVPRRLRQEESNALTDDDEIIPQHILYKKTVKHFCGQSNLNNGRIMKLNSYSQRGKREVPDKDENLTKTIETAVFIDNVLYGILAKENPDDPIDAILNMVFTMINAVQIIYNQPSLSTRINFVLVKVVILTGSGGPSKEKGDINDYLKTFCKWQARRNPQGDDNDEHWDHALMLTGLDLYMDDPENTIVIGLAWVSGMCHRQYSCSLNEGTTFESVYVISHELGHNLGMQHDGEDNDNECSETDYIMSSSLGPGKTTWSKCSDVYLSKFLGSSMADCLDDFVTPGEGLDHRSNELPGEQYTATVQCRLSFGSKYHPYITDEDPFEDLCRELWCANGTIARRAHPALVGTQCGIQKVCFQGKCLKRQDAINDLKSHNLLPESEKS